MPTDIKTELAEATATRAQLERGLTAATTGGVAQQAIAQATQRAIAALERARAEAEQKKLDLEGRNTRLAFRHLLWRTAHPEGTSSFCFLW